MFQLWDPNWIGTCFAVFICESANVGCWPGVVPCPSWDAAPSCGWSDQAIRGSLVKKLVKNPFQKNDPPIIICHPPMASDQIQWEFEGFLRSGEVRIMFFWNLSDPQPERWAVFGILRVHQTCHGKRLHKTFTIASKFETGANTGDLPGHPLPSRVL